MAKSNKRSFAQAFCGVLVLLLAWSAQAAVNPTTASEQRMTPEKFAEYVKLFNARDERFAEFYTEDVEFPHKAGVVLRGRRAIIDFYKNMWQGIKETLTTGAVIIDNERGLMAVEMTVHLEAKPKASAPAQAQKDASVLPGRALKPGETLIDKSVVIYTLRDGKISHIRGAIQGNETIPAESGAKQGT